MTSLQQSPPSSPGSSSTLSSPSPDEALVQKRRPVNGTSLELSRSLYGTPQLSQRSSGTIRIDSTIITSFDPADKELYDLWAPKQN